MSLEHSPARQGHVTLDRVLRWPEVAEVTGLSRSTIWRLTKAGRFPKPIHPTPTTVGWFAREISEWLARRAEARNGN
jgi:prophage regulatory protein